MVRPFFAIAYMKLKINNDIILVLRIICVCALFNTGAALVEFRLQRNLFVQMFPSGMLADLIQSNPLLSQAFCLVLWQLPEMAYTERFRLLLPAFFRRI